MNYDPIHDTYTPSAEHKSRHINGDGVSLIYGGTPGPAPVAMGGFQSSLSETYSEVPKTSEQRHASNLHQLLDNSEDGRDYNSNGQWNSYASNGANGLNSSNGVGVNGDYNHSLRRGQEDVNEGSLHYFVSHEPDRGNGWGSTNTNPYDHYGKQTDNSSSALNGSKVDGPHTPQRPLKDVKLSIGNLVAPEMNDEASQSSREQTELPLEQEDKSGESEESGESAGLAGSESAESTVPGSLPSDFLSISTGFKHLKKRDGEPFWRRDIQHDFLAELFNDEHKVFTNHFPHCEVPNASNEAKLTFSELYVRTLAESSKASKVLRERLIKDREMGVAVSKVCLLVNAGRMNTTVNFVPDMRSALRTYHSIPCLQASPDGQSKPLQDTPRLKTILKAVCEGQDHLQTLLDILHEPAAKKPNTNIIKLIFLMSTFFHRVPYQNEETEDCTPIAELKPTKVSSSHPNNFMEFFLSDEIYPKNRANRFLWLMYTYMETSFSEEELELNPFNAKVIPPIELISPEHQNSFDQDTELEVEYAKKMYQTRMAHLSEELGVTTPKRGAKAKREKTVSTDSASPVDPEAPLVSDVQEDGAVSASQNDHFDLAEETVVVKMYNPRRRKYTSSGSYIVDDKKVESLTSWRNPEFPVCNLKRICRRIAKHTKGVELHALNESNPLSTPLRKTMAASSNNVVAHMNKFVPNFGVRRKETAQWMYRYFQYKKSTDNGLVSMEWENMRHDVLHGFEAYSYQQLGKVLEFSKEEENSEKERHENAESEPAKKSHLNVGLKSICGDSAPVDIDEIGALGATFAPMYDFDRANERSTYEYMMTHYVSDTIWRNVNAKISQAELFRFDLDAGVLHHK